MLGFYHRGMARHEALAEPAGHSPQNDPASPSSPGSRWGSAKESQAQPPHHKVRAPMTENPSGTAENGPARFGALGRGRQSR